MMQKICLQNLHGDGVEFSLFSVNAISIVPKEVE
jgi:hypothetical protein